MKAAGIIFTDGDKILLLKRKTGDHSGTWAIPGGKAHENETPHQNAKRESQEEIGTVQGKPFDKYLNGNFTGFLYKVPSLFKIKLNKEHSEYEWVKIQDVVNKELHPEFKKEWPIYLSKIKNNKKKTFKEWISINHIPA